jgi:SAM-dependent methyltransferase
VAHEESPYIRRQRQRAAIERQAQTRIDEIVRQTLALPDSDLPPIWMINKIGSHSTEHFKTNGAWTFAEMARRGRLHANSRVIDLGSGCGRLAIPFTRLITEGDYYGTDVFEEGIAWCQAHIGRRYPRFKFFLQDVPDSYYFGGEVKAAADLNFRFADTNSIDFIFAISVFTHLVEADAQTYLQEIARTLQPDGVAYLTCFIIDRTFPAYVRRTGLHTAVKEVSSGYYQAYTGQDFFAAYEYGRWKSLVENAGLEIGGFDPGTWAEKRGARQYQDTFILTKQA